MNDLLQSTSRLGRSFGLVLSILGALLSWSIALLGVTMLFEDQTSAGKHVTTAVILLLFGPLALYCSCLAWCLGTHRRANNGITVMPAWTIQTFGMFLLLGSAWAIYSGRSLVATQFGTVAGAMILVGRNIAARQRRQQNAQTNTASTDQPPDGRS